MSGIHYPCHVCMGNHGSQKKVQSSEVSAENKPQILQKQPHLLPAKLFLHPFIVFTIYENFSCPKSLWFPSISFR